MARMARNAAKTGNVVSFPPMRSVPAPDFPLKGIAYDKYLEMATSLVDGGRLNIHTKALCEQIGILYGEQYKRIENGLPVSAKSQERLARLIGEIRAVDESDVIPVSNAGKTNRFEKYGTILHRGAAKAEIRAP